MAISGDARGSDMRGIGSGDHRAGAGGWRTGGSSSGASCDGGALDVGSLAAAALSVLAAERCAPRDAGRDDRFAARIDALCGALTHADAAHARAHMSKLRAFGVEADEFVDRVAPAAARRLGAQWVGDQLSFAEVSIGAARLQKAVRALEDAPRRAHAAGPSAPQQRGAAPLGQCVLMVVPDFEQHTLGAFVAADRLRRLGLWTEVRVGLSLREIAALAATQRFAAVGLSSSSRRALDPLRRLIESLRRDAGFSGVIGVGGVVATMSDEARRSLEADIVTADAARFAALCEAQAPSGSARIAAAVGATAG
ncbi:MAG: hypothetical protein AAGM38_02375 [Pseudomonadota bacterium]